MKLDSKIKKILEFVWNSPYSSFYKDKYTKAGINLIKDINSMEDFKKLPYLTKDELVSSDPFSRFYLPWSEFGTVSISSGTTKNINSLSVVFRQQNLARQIYKDKGGKSRDDFHVTSIMKLLSPHQAAMHLLDRKRIKDNAVCVLGDINNLPLSAKIAAKLKIDLLVTSPTALYFFIPFLEKEYSLDNIKRISLIGEFCSKQKDLIFKKKFKNTRFIYNYGMSEAQGGAIGLSCGCLDTLSTNYFHKSSNYYYEVINSSGDSELFLTNLYKNGFPLIRYKTGDAIEVEDYDCGCGQKERFKILGRINYDALKIHGVFIYADLVEKALLPFQQYLSSPKFQLHVFEDLEKEKIIPRLKLQLILKKGYQGKSEKLIKLIVKGFSEELYLSARRTLASLVSEEIFKPLEVEFINSFPMSSKHKKIVSHLD
ncbi:MAG: hypothetical protein PHQ59_00045 [Candidatus Daviesbacteria bacterium]|nr:hypothetical protein [Candidatus Daviesbacteria bacterium]